MRILSRYVLKSLIGPFVFSLSALTLLMLLNELGKRFGKLLGKGLEAGVIVEVFALSIPFILAMSLPMAVLAAVLFSFNRMASDNEITAMKANGIHLPRLVVPVVGAATVLALGMVWFNNSVLPDSNHRLQVLLSSISQKKPTFVLKERTVNEVLEGELFIQAARVNRKTNELTDVVIYDQRVPEQSRTIYADNGKMALSEDRTDLFLTLRRGQSQEQKVGEPDALQRMHFEHMVMRVPDVSNKLRRREMGGYRGDREMSIPQLRAEVRKSQGRASVAELESRTYAVAVTRRLLGLEVETPEGLEERLMRSVGRSAAADGDDGVRRALAAEAPDTGGGEPTGNGRDAATAGTRITADTTLDGSAPGAAPAPARGTARGPGAVDPPSGAGPGAADTAGAGSGATADTAVPDTGAAADTPGAVDTADTAADASTVDTAAIDAQVQALSRAHQIGSARTPQANFGSLTRRRGTALSQSSRYAVEIHKKYSIPAACIVFVLIGAPLAVRFREAGVAMVVAASLLIFCAYYVSLVGGEELADELLLSPFWAMWAPNVLFGAVGLSLLWQSVKVG